MSNLQELRKRMSFKAFSRRRGIKNLTPALGGVALTVLLCLQVETSAQQVRHRPVLDRYCVTCHNERVKTAGLMLDRADISNPGANAEVWDAHSRFHYNRPRKKLPITNC